MEVETPLHPRAMRSYDLVLRPGLRGTFHAPGGCGSVNVTAYGGGGGGGSGIGGCGGSSGGANGGGGGEYAYEANVVTGQGYGFAAGGIVRQCECLTCKQHRAGVNRWQIP